MTQQTAVEWLVDNIWRGEPTLHQKILIEQAKTMEKEQIINAHGNKTSRHIQQGIDVYLTRTGENYYNETYTEKDIK